MEAPSSAARLLLTSAKPEQFEFCVGAEPSANSVLRKLGSLLWGQDACERLGSPKSDRLLDLAAQSVGVQCEVDVARQRKEGPRVPLHGSDAIVRKEAAMVQPCRPCHSAAS